MALKPSQITRRNFVQRAGLLVTSLGVAGGIQSGLMDSIIRKANKKWGGEALAAAGGPVAFSVEILFRAGFQMNSLFPSRGHKEDARNPALNIYSSPNSILEINPTGNKKAYIASFGAGMGGDKLRTVINTINAGGERVGLATSEAIVLQTSQHTGNFASRAPNTNAACPAVMHAAVAPSVAVNGIEWNNGVATTNQRGSLAALARVKDRTEFQSLFRDLPMYFTKEELQLIVGVIDNGSTTTRGSIDDLDDMFRIKNVQGSNEVAQVSLAGRGQAQLSLIAALDTAYNNNMARFGTPAQLNQALGGAQLGVAMNSAIAAFSVGASTTFTISLDSNDWHGDINPMDSATDKQGIWNTYVGNALAGFLDAAANTVNPHAPTEKIIDSLCISLQSEFTRTPNRNGGGTGGDNGDGGQGSMAFIGSRVKTGAYGDILGSGAVRGFDPTSGATIAASPNVTEAMVWKTHAELLGIPASMSGMVAAQPVMGLVKTV